MPRPSFIKSLILCSLLLLAFRQPALSPSLDLADDGDLLLGNPSKAASASSSNYLLNRQYFVVGFNASRNIPNWVSWHLDTDDLGGADRQNDFRPDAELPSSWYWVGEKDYKYSGFDRGHNCPSADRTISAAANSATFLMSNMIPQAPNHNRQLWAHFEEYIRNLVEAGNEAFIVMGNYGQGGTGDYGFTQSIDDGHIAVPARIWKVVVVLPRGNHDLERINTKTRVIAVDSPNTNVVKRDWRLYRTSVNAIEKATGYDLLSNLPEAVQQVVESKIDRL